MNNLVFDGTHYIAFKLTEACRSKLMEMYPPKFDVVKLDHVTIAYDFIEDNITSIQELILNTPQFEVIGRMIGDGIECFTVLANGVLKRPVDSIYHLTISHDDRHNSVDSTKLFSREEKVLAYAGASMVLEGEYISIPKIKKVCLQEV